MKVYFKKRAFSFVYAFKGIRTLLGTQPNAVIHLVFTTLAVLAGFFFELSGMEWVGLIFAIALVWITEAFNTALEFLTDLVSPDYHPLAGKAKDVAAAAVLLSAILSIVIGLLIFVPKLLHMVKLLN